MPETPARHQHELDLLMALNLALQVTKGYGVPELESGLTRAEAWDVIEIAAMYNFTNRLAMGTNMLPNEEYSGQARPVNA